MVERTARVIRRPDGQFEYELTITRGPFPTGLEAGQAARAEIVADAESEETEHKAIRAGCLASHQHPMGRRELPRCYYPDCETDENCRAYPCNAPTTIRAAIAVAPRLLNDRELAAVLAGLRIFQMVREHKGIVDVRLWEIMDEIGTNGGAIEPMDPNELDALCERLNSGGGYHHVTPHQGQDDAHEDHLPDPVVAADRVGGGRGYSAKMEGAMSTKMLEPAAESAFVYASATDPQRNTGVCLASIAISLKRIADALEGTREKFGLVDSLQEAITRGIVDGMRR